MWGLEQGVNEVVLNEHINTRGQSIGLFFRLNPVFFGFLLPFLAGCRFKGIG